MERTIPLLAPLLRTPPLVDDCGREQTYLRLSVTDRCNLRCVYCMPDGVTRCARSEILSLEEIERLARICVGLGVRKIRLTGGEPTVRRGLEGLIGRLARIPGLETLAMTTNGILLAERAATLRRLGLQALNISLDTLRPERFEAITGCDRLDDVLAGIEAALEAGFAPLKINMVVMGGVNDDELLDFVELARERPISVRFIEYMPFRGNSWDSGGLVPYERMLEVIGGRYELRPMVQDAHRTPSGPPMPSRSWPLLMGEAGRRPGEGRWAGGPGQGLDEGYVAASSSTAREFSIPGFIGSIGIITAMSHAFCGQCNRLRLRANGALKTCLFRPAEVNLLGPMRAGADDQALAEMIRAAVAGKAPARPEPEDFAQRDDRSMVQIGG